MLIVVSGHSRGVGKTSLVEAILKVSRPTSFSTLKISGHHHGGTEAVGPRREETGSRGSRLLGAGAQSAWFVGAADDHFPLALPAIEELMSASRNWIVESNRLIAYLRPELLLFVCHPEIVDWKASAHACLRSCDAVVFRNAASVSTRRLQRSRAGASTERKKTTQDPTPPTEASESRYSLSTHVSPTKGGPDRQRIPPAGRALADEDARRETELPPILAGHPRRTAALRAARGSKGSPSGDQSSISSKSHAA